MEARINEAYQNFIIDFSSYFPIHFDPDMLKTPVIVSVLFYKYSL
jgi:hypothetical protein